MKHLLLAFWVPILASSTAVAQPGGPPRRIDRPEEIILSSGAQVDFRSFSAPSLGQESQYSIFLPASYGENPERKYPVVYFLHGMFNDHTSWAVERYGSLPQRLDQLMREGKLPEFILVSPNGGSSFYTDYLDGSHNYERLILEDIVREVERHFRARTDRQHRAIAGVSMGGYGALKVAMKKPELYSAVAAASPIVLLGSDPSSAIRGSTSRMAGHFTNIFTPLFGVPFDPKHWEENSLEAIARRANVGDLKIHFAYGTADRYNDAFPMELGVNTLSRILAERRIPHVFKTYENEPHGWDLVSKHLEEMADFVSQTFR